MKTRIRHLTYVVIAILLLLILGACRSSKSERSNLNQTGHTKQINEIESSETTVLYSEIEKMVERVLTEQLNIHRQEVEYDTEKPIVPHTGKPPIKRESEISVGKKTEDKLNVLGTNNTQVSVISSTEGHTETATDIKTESRITEEVNRQKEADIFLKWVGGISLSLVILCLGCYILYKRIKKRIPV